MIDLPQIATFVGVVALLFIVPGPAVLLTLARSTSGGTRVGMATGAGIAAGDGLHTLAAVVGLSAVLMASAVAFDLVKYLGAAYLVYLGVMAMREQAANVSLPSLRPITPARAFRQAVVAEVLNPKTALFFLSFLPQFTEPSRGSLAAQLLLLGAIFVAMSLAYTSLLAVGAARISGWLTRRTNLGRWPGRLVGGIYIGLGVNLALQQRG